MKKTINEYPNILNKLENNYLGENAPKDSKGRFFSEGIVHVNEGETLEGLMSEYGGEFEVPYKELCELPSYIKRSPRLDYRNGNIVMEYKKVRTMYDRGGLDEYTLGKLFNPSASQAYMNPFTDTSVASNSLTGDIEKLLMLPDTFDRYVVLELWSGEPYTSEPYINMLNTMLNQYYDLEFTSEVYNGIHPKLTRCDILCYKVLGKK